MKFALNITCDNAAFCPVYDDASEEARYDSARGEVARILDNLRVTLREEIVRGGERSGFLRDTNGNRVGQWSLSEEDEAEPCNELEGLRAAARNILANWERGDLAGAVRDLAAELGDEDEAQAPEGWTHAETSADAEPPAPGLPRDANERVWRVVYHPEGMGTTWTLQAAHYTLEEAGAEVERLTKLDRLTQVVRDPS